MKAILTILMLFVITTNTQAKSTVDLTNFISGAQHQIDELNTLIDDISRDRIGKVYFDKLTETKVKLARIKSEPLENKNNIGEINRLYSEIEYLLNPNSQKIANINRASKNVINTESTGVISGKITNALLASELNNISVRLYDELGNYVTYVGVDELGRFFFSNLSDGNYIIIAWPGYNLRDNYVATAQPQKPCVGGIGLGCLLQDLSLISIAQGSIVENENIELAKVSTISGTIQNSAGSNFLESTSLRLYDENQNSVYSGYVYSDNLGKYTINVPQPGKYYLKASHSGYSSQLFDGVICEDTCDFTSATLIKVDDGENITSIDFSLNQFTDISGNMLDADTQVMLTSGDVYLYDEYDHAVANTNVSSSGNWYLDKIAPHNYTLRSSSDGYLASVYNSISCITSQIGSCQQITGTEISHNSSQATENIIMKHYTGATISGTVFDNNNNPISNAYITVYDQNQNNSLNYYSSYIRTDENGKFETFAINNGRYYLEASSDRYDNELYPNTLCTNVPCEFSQANLITINNFQSVQNINFHLNDYSTLSGRVVDANNNPINDVSVRLVESTQSTNNYSNHVYTDANGEYQFDRIPTGTYKVYVSSQEYYSEMYNNITCSAYDCRNASNYTVISLSQSQRSNINFQLTKKGTVRFNLTSNSQNEVTDGVIKIYDSQGIHINDIFTNKVSLPVGNYYFVYFSSYYNHFVNKNYGGSNCFSDCVPTRGTRVSIRNNIDTVLNMNLDEYFYINVSTQSISGNVQLYQADSSYYYSRGNYSNKMYISDNLPKRLKVGLQGYYSFVYNNIDCLDSECDLSQGQLIQPQLNTSLDINYTLKPISTLSGRVTDFAGNPVEGVDVELSTNINYFGKSVSTNANGEYMFIGVDVGDYYLRAVSRSYSSPNIYERTYYGDIACAGDCNGLGIQTISINKDDQLTSYDIQMVTRGTISGENITNVFNEYVPAEIRIYKVNGTYLTYIAAVSVNIDGTIPKVYLSEGSYKLLGKTGSSNYSGTNRVYTAYPNRTCVGLNTSSCAELSTVLMVTNTNDTHINNFVLHEAGKIAGFVYDSVTHVPLNNFSVKFYKVGDGLDSSYVLTQENGEYTNHLSRGDYRIFITYDRYGENKYINQLYNNINCFDGLGIDCTLTDGDTVHVTDDSKTAIDIYLKQKPKLLVHLKDKYSLEDIYSRLVVFDANHNIVYNKFKSNPYEHLIEGLAPGNYSLIGASAYSNLSYNITGYPDVNCTVVDSIQSCQSTLTEVSLSLDDTLKEINIYTMLNDGINGKVIDDKTNLPIPNIVVDFWKNNRVVDSVVTNSLGKFSSQLGMGDYYLSTDTGNAYYDEIYKDYECEYPAILGTCDISKGQLISVPENNLNPIIIDVELSTSSERIYMNGFE